MKTRHLGLLTSSLVAVAGLSSCSNGAPQKASKPNVLLLLADDLGYGELGSYGHLEIKTPVLDSLAKAGVRFTDFHAGNAVSSASRAVLMTGIHSGQNTIRGNKGYQLPEGRTRVGLKPEDVTMAEMLKEQGYQTAFIGKWHVENPCDLSTWAYYRGFDYAAQEQWGDTGCKNTYQEGTEYINGVQDSIIYDHTQWECKDEFRTQIALDYIDNQLDKDKPFFLFMSYRAPHAHEYNIRHNDLYQDKGWTEEERLHAAKITMLDKQIGRLLHKLRKEGELDNTLVIFTSDNGPHNEAHDYEFHHSNGQFRGYKRDMYEGGHRVPCIITWDGHIEAGQTSDFICGGEDIVPTVAAATGAVTPQASTGISILTHMTTGETPQREAIYHEIFDSAMSRQAVRMGSWKAVRYGVASPIELYNLDQDPSERHNLASTNPQQVAKMTPLFESMRTENKFFPRHQENVRKRFLSTKTRIGNFNLRHKAAHFKNFGGIQIPTVTARDNQALLQVNYTLNTHKLNKEQLDAGLKRYYTPKAGEMTMLIRSIVFDQRGIEVMRTSEAKVLPCEQDDLKLTQTLQIDYPALGKDKYFLKSEIVYLNKVVDDVLTPFEIN